MVRNHIEKAQKAVYRKAMEIGIPELVFGIGFGFVSLMFVLTFHELAHRTVAILLGYPARIEALLLFEGWTKVYADITNPLHLALIAGAGPFSCVLLGEYFWRFGRTSPLRYTALIDAWYLYLTVGPAWTWFTFITIFGYVWARWLFGGVGPVRWE